MKPSVNLENNEIIFALNSKIYPLDAVYNACYVFIDRMYIYLDSSKKNEIIVSLKTKGKATKDELEDSKNEFFNELLNVSLRKNISKQNHKILEYIVGGAITASLEKPEMENKKTETGGLEKEIASLKEKWDKKFKTANYKKDPLGIGKVYSKGKPLKKNRK